MSDDNTTPDDQSATAPSKPAAAFPQSQTAFPQSQAAFDPFSNVTPPPRWQAMASGAAAINQGAQAVAALSRG